MPFCTLNGTEYRVLTDGAEEEEAAWGGVLIDFAFDGSLQADYAPEVRRFSLPFEPMLEADFVTFRALLNSGLLTLSGDCVNGASVSVLAKLKSAGYIPDGTVHRRTPVVEFTASI